MSRNFVMGTDHNRPGAQPARACSGRFACLALAACCAASMAGAASAKPLKAFILAGQSNMQGHAEKWVLPGMAADPATKPLYDKLVDADGNVRLFMVAGDDPLYQPTETRLAYAVYGDLLACLIRDVRKEFKASEMPFVIGVIGTGVKPEEKNPFREAIAAPAALPEFKGNVTAVHTAKYFDEKLGELADRSWRWQRPAWDPENQYADLRAKLAPLQKQLNETKNIEDQAARNARSAEISRRIREITYTEEELKYLEMNKCNHGNHYLGSAKMLGRFGEAYARAMIEMQHPWP